MSATSKSGRDENPKDSDKNLATSSHSAFSGLPALAAPLSLITGIYDTEIPFTPAKSTDDAKTLVKKMSASKVDRFDLMQDNHEDRTQMRRPLHTSNPYESYSSSYAPMNSPSKSINASFVSSSQVMSPRLTETPEKSHIEDSANDLWKSSIYNHHQRIARAADEILHSTPMKGLLFDDDERLATPKSKSAANDSSRPLSTTSKVGKNLSSNFPERKSGHSTHETENSAMKVLIKSFDPTIHDRGNSLPFEDIDVLKEYDIQNESTSTTYSVVFPAGPMGLELEVRQTSYPSLTVQRILQPVIVTNKMKFDYSQ